jgi:hypothetical protein
MIKIVAVAVLLIAALVSVTQPVLATEREGRVSDERPPVVVPSPVIGLQPVSLDAVQPARNANAARADAVGER